MTDLDLIAEERVRKRAAARARPFTLRQVTAVAVDTDALTATVDPGDGRRIVVTPVDGTLPAPGDEVTAFKIGDAWFCLGNTLLARGTKQSIGFTPGSTGWGQDANGDFEANNGTFRGTVAAAEFTTSEDEDDPRVVISSANDARSVLLYSGDPDELLPAALTSFTDGTRQVVRLRSGEFTAGGAGKHAVVDVGIDPVTGATFGEAIADDWRVNGVSISRPPYSAKRRVAGLAVGSSTTAAQAILWDADLVVAPDSLMSYDASSGLWTIKRKGVYRSPIIWSFGDASGGGDGTRRLLIEEDGVQRTVIGVAAAGNNGNNTVLNATAEIIVPDDAGHTVRWFAGQWNGIGLGLSGTGRASISRFSG